MHSFACLQPIKAMTKLLEFLGMQTHITKNGPAMVEPAISYHVICQGGSDIPTSPLYLHSYLGFLTGFCNVLRTDVPTCREQCTSQSKYVNDKLHSRNFSGIRTIYSEPSSLIMSCYPWQGCRQGEAGGGGAEAPPDFKLMLLCVQAVTAKGHPKFRKNERKKQLSGYKQCYTYKNQSSEVFKFGSHYVLQTRSKRLSQHPLLKSCLRPCTIRVNDRVLLPSSNVVSLIKGYA